MRLRLAPALLVLALVATMTSPVAAQESSELDPQILDELDTTAEEILEIEPNDAWDQLGLLSDDATRLLGAATQPTEVITYAFGDDRNTPPIIDPAGATPVGIGSLLVEIPDDWERPAEGLTQTMAFAETPSSQLSPGDTAVLMWIELDDDYDFTSGLTINEGFPLTLPDQPVWNSTFAGDTWEGANLIPNAVFDGTSLTFDVKRYEPPQSFPIVDLAGFYFRAGNVMAMALDADALLALLGSRPADAATASEGTNQTLLFTGDTDTVTIQDVGLWMRLEEIAMQNFIHIAIGLFEAGHISLTEDGPFLTPFDFVLIASISIALAQIELTEELREEEAAEEEEEAEPEAAPDPAPTAAPVDTTTSTTASSDSGGGFPIILILILLGILVFLIGLATRKKTKTSGGTKISDETEQEDVATTPAPTPASTPASSTQEPTGLRPVIFVPGIMASALQVQTAHGPEQVWPPTGYGYDVPRSFEALQATDASKIKISESAANGLLPFIHLGLLGHLETMGYQLEPTDGKPANCYVHSYNWMQSCALAGADLVKLIARATAEHGQPPSIIAHSMGGLVTRSALLGGKAKVDKVFFCATPHYGAPMAYYALHPDIPYEFVPGTIGKMLNAAYANATSSHGSDVLFRGSPGIAVLQELIETAAHLVTGSPGFNEHLKKVSANATGVFELIPDDLYFEHVNPSWPVATHKDKWYRGSATYERHDYTPRSASETYFEDNRKDIPALPPQFGAQVEAALAFKKSISVPLPPGGAEKTIVVYGAKHHTVCEAEMTDDGDATQRGNISATIGGDQGGDGTVPKESGRGEALHHDGVVLQRDDTAEHFMMTETKTFHAVLSQYLEPGGR